MKKTKKSVKVYTVTANDELLKLKTIEAAEMASFTHGVDFETEEVSESEFSILEENQNFSDNLYLQTDLKVVVDEPEAIEKTELQILQESVKALTEQMQRMQKENEELKKKDKKKLTLSESITLFEKKKKLIDNLSSFENAVLEINKMEIVKDDKYGFTAHDKYCLALSSNDYNRKDVFKITNNYILGNFKEFILARIAEKCEDIKEELTTLEI